MAEIFTEFLNWGLALIDSWGYLGVFLISLIGNMSLFLPIPSYIVVLLAGSVLNPWLLGIAGGLGAAIGELTGYVIGRGGRYVIRKKYRKLLQSSKKWSEKHGLFPLIVLFAATPLPDDIVGILSGIIKYDLRKFLLANIIGKIIAYTSLAWVGFYGSWMMGGWNMLFFVVLSFVFLAIVFKAIQAEKGRKRG